MFSLNAISALFAIAVFSAINVAEASSYDVVVSYNAYLSQWHY